MNELKVRKGVFQHIENELYDYHETRKAIIRLKNDLLYSSPSHDNNGGGRSNLPSDPTGRTASLMASDKRITEMERIILAIDAVMERLPKEKKDLVTLVYWTRPQLLTWAGIALQLNCNRATAIRWRNEVVRAIAVTRGWG